MEDPTTKSDAKMELVETTYSLMPQGKPDYLGVVKYPMIRDIVAIEGRKKMIMIIALLVKDFAASINVVRNMNEDQIIETAAMMVEECDNFRIEDYVMMFSMAKKGELVKIMDRLDIQLISNMMDEYWLRRKKKGQEVQEEGIRELDSLGPTARSVEIENPQDVELSDRLTSLSSAMRDLKINLKNE